MFGTSNDNYYEEQEQFTNPLSAEFFQIKRELWEDHMMNMENQVDPDDEMTLNDELANKFEDALEGFLQNFVKNGLTMRGMFLFLSIAILTINILFLQKMLKIIYFLVQFFLFKR